MSTEDLRQVHRREEEGPLLEVEDLHTFYFTKEGVVKAVNGVSLELRQDTILGVVGESGSGKTATALSIVGLIPHPGRIVEGSVRYKGRELTGLRERDLRTIRGREISLVFQDAQTALNPTMRIRDQVQEVMFAHLRITKDEADERTLQLLAQMGIADGPRVMDQYPFQISGGMAQRIVMATAIALDPRVLIADEPTSNLDVTLQAEILQRLKRLTREQLSGMLLITHDLGVIAQMAEQVAVMYGGMIVEFASTEDLFAKPHHPYTHGLFQALPRVDTLGASLTPMPGTPPSMVDPPDQCPFLSRCPKASTACRTSPRPPLEELEEGHWVACYNPVVQGVTV